MFSERGAHARTAIGGREPAARVRRRGRHGRSARLNPATRAIMGSGPEGGPHDGVLPARRSRPAQETHPAPQQRGRPPLRGAHG
ncbi:hypothetical protein ACFPM0_20995 [Pseudonocardia sulfidoxydans]|uniref:hypothetical protein n=1 Tax=Pseudonocardia sulfidoxydans TaxID=54011 RepID=UPI003620C605